MGRTTHLRLSWLSLFVVFLLLLPNSSESCVSCFHPRSFHQNANNHRHGAHSIAITASATGYNGRMKSIAVATTAARQVLEVFQKRCLQFQRSAFMLPRHNKFPMIPASLTLAAGGIVVVARHGLPLAKGQQLHRRVWRNEVADGQEGISSESDEEEAGDKVEPRPKVDESAMSSGMIATIGIYKNFISPLLPPACRFVPTCSQYGVQAIKEYGSAKGVVLTSWRLLRCSPFGGKGYDPPKWPPVSYTYSSY